MDIGHRLLRVALQDWRENRLVLGHILKVNHAAKMKVTEFLSNRMITQFEFNICRIARNCLFTDVDNSLTSQYAAIAKSDPMKAPAVESFNWDLPDAKS